MILNNIRRIFLASKGILFKFFKALGIFTEDTINLTSKIILNIIGVLFIAFYLVMQFTILKTERVYVQENYI